MAVTGNAAVYAAYLLQLGEIDLEADMLKLALMNSTITFDPDRHRVWDASAWAASTGHSVGDLVKPTTENGYIYRCTSAGTSDSSEPSWPTTFGNTVNDNDVTWECWSYNTSEDEITQENGYTAPVSLSNGSALLDEANNQSTFTCDDVQITASGGSFGPTGAAVIYDDTHAEDPIIGFIDFDDDYTLTDGTPLNIEDIEIQTVAKQGVTA